jgi:hypothetical protein
MTLHEKFGWHTPLADYVARLPASYPDPTSPKFKDASNPYRTDHDCAATCAVLVGDSRVAISSAKECVRVSLDYFHGQWRQGAPLQLNKPRWMPYDWYSVAPTALFWASALGDWEAVRSLCQFPRVPPKWEWPEHAYLSLLGFFMRGETLEQHAPTIDYIRSKRKLQPKLLLECLFALASRNAAQFQAAWQTYLDYFLKHERNQHRLDLLQSRNASFYAAAADHFGILLNQPAKYKDYVVGPLQPSAARRDR